MISFQRPTADGWRYGLGWRTRRVNRRADGRWILERWNGEDWIRIGFEASYGKIRERADAERERLRQTPTEEKP